MLSDGDNQPTLARARVLFPEPCNTVLPAVGGSSISLFTVAGNPTLLSGVDVLWLSPGTDNGQQNALLSMVLPGQVLANYVNAGGVLVVNAGSTGAVGHAVIGPGDPSGFGPGWNSSTAHDALAFTSNTHPYVLGTSFGGVLLAENLFSGWGFTAEGVLTNLGALPDPPIAPPTVILETTDATPDPVLAEYNLGAGSVILSTVMFGIGDPTPPQPPNFGPHFDNLLRYAMHLSGAPSGGAVSIDCPPNVFDLECGSDLSPATTGQATATGCGTITVSFANSMPAGCSGTGTITRTWTADDGNGNTDQCDQIITVVDTTDPTVDTTPITAVDVDCSGDEAVLAPATDDCDDSPTVSGDPPGFYTAGEMTTVTFTAEDACGRTSVEEVDVTVKYGATIKVFVHQLRFGWGRRPSITKESLVRAEVFVFARPTHEFCSHHQWWWRGWQWWRHIVAGCDESAAVNSGRTNPNGIAEIDVPPGDYLVVTFFDFNNNGVRDHFIGRRARNLHCGQVLKRRLRLLVTPRGRRIAARIRRHVGSELLIVEPDTMVWDAEVQEYPFGFESEGDWGVQTSIEVPEGFVADVDTLDEDVVDTTRGLQFTVTEVGSDLVPTRTEFTLRHNGRVIVVPSDVGILLTPDYALSRGFDVDALRASGLIVEPSELGRDIANEGDVAPATPGAIAPGAVAPTPGK